MGTPPASYLALEGAVGSLSGFPQVLWLSPWREAERQMDGAEIRSGAS